MSFPVVNILTPNNYQYIYGLTEVKANIDESNIDYWQLTINEVNSSNVIIEKSGTNDINGNNVLVSKFDASTLATNTIYELKLKVVDKAGNETSTSKTVIVDEYGSISMIPNVFRLDKVGQVDEPWLCTSEIQELTLQTKPLALPIVPFGDWALFVDGKIVNEGTSSDPIILDVSDDSKYPDGSIHQAVVRVIDSLGNPYYSAAIQKRVIPFDNLMTDSSMSFWHVKLDYPEKLKRDNLVSMTINGVGTGFETYDIKLMISGLPIVPITIGEKILIEDIDELFLDGMYSNYIIVSIQGDIQNIEELNFEFEYLVEDYENAFKVELLKAPSNVTATPQVNYMTLLRWDKNSEEVEYWYNVYRRVRNDYDGEFIKIASGIKESYYYDNNLNYGEEFEYLVTAEGQFGGVLRETTLRYDDPNKAWARVVDENEMDKRLGLQSYWDYTPFTTQYGTGYIESSQGNLVYQVVDAIVSGPKLGLVMRRTYNSQSSIKTPLGYGWDFSFNTTLLKEVDDNGILKALILKDGDGTFHRFEAVYDSSGNIIDYVSPTGIKMKLVYDDISNTYSIVREDGITYVFDNTNVLIEMNDRTGDRISFEYDDRGNIARVSNIANQAIEFNYQQYQGLENQYDLLKSISLPNGEEIDYSFNNEDRLANVQQKISTSADEDYTVRRSSKQRYEYDNNNMLVAFKDTTCINTPTVGCGLEIEYDNKARPIVISLPKVLGESDRSKSYFSYNTVAGNNKLTVETIAISGISLGENIVILNSDGNLISKKDVLGNEVTFEYDNRFNVIRSTYPFVRSSVDNSGVVTSGQVERLAIELSYDSRNNVTSVTDATGNTSYYKYEDSNNPFSVTEIKSFNKDGNNNTITIIDSYSYDIYGNLISHTDGLNKTETYGYDSIYPFLRTSSTDRFGNTTTYQYDNLFRLSKVIDPSGAAITITEYDDNNQIVKAKDALGKETEFVYNEQGVQLCAIRPDGSKAAAVIDLNGQLINASIMSDSGSILASTSYSYDELGRNKTRSMDGLVYQTKYGYDISNGSPVATILGIDYYYLYWVKEYLPNENTAVNIKYFDKHGLLVREVTDGVNLDYVYNSIGVLVGTVDGNGIESRVIFDEYGNQTAMVVNPNTSNAIVQRVEYDLLGNALSSTDGEGNITNYSYDKLSRLKSVTQYPNTTQSITTSYYYDEIVGGKVQNRAVYENGMESISTFDSVGNLIKESQIGVVNNTTTTISKEYFYDANHNVIKTELTDGTENWFEYNYNNELSKIIYEKDELTGQPIHYSQYQFDALGRRTYSKDFKRMVMPLQEGQLTSDIQDIVNETYMMYNNRDQLVQYIKNGIPVIFSYDDAGSLTGIKYQNASTLLEAENVNDNNWYEIKYQYNDRHLLSQIDVKYGGTTYKVATYDYSSTNRLESKKVYRDFADGNTTDYLESLFSYNDWGLTSEITYKDSTNLVGINESYSYSYDKRGFITSEIDINNYQEEARESFKTFEYDDIGRLLGVIDEVTTGAINPSIEVVNTSYKYDLMGNRIEFIDSEGKTTYNYNQLNQLTKSIKKDINNTKTLETIDYLYDVNGNMVQKVVELEKEEISEQYALYPKYTMIGELKKVCTIDFGYDKAGQLADTNVEYVVSGQITKLKPKNGGSTINVPSNQGKIDPTTTQTKDSVYAYDADGIRTTKFTYNVDVTESTPLTDAVETQYFYFGDNLLFTADINGYKLTENVIDPWGNTIVSKRYESIVETDNNNQEVIVGFDVNYFTFNTDKRGSTTNIIRPDGTVVTGYVYDEFGNLIKSGEEDFINDMTYTGSIFDCETELQYMNARYYDASSGRFISQDSYRGSLANPQTQHLYSYTSNNPVNFIDPTGHRAIQPLKPGVGVSKVVISVANAVKNTSNSIHTTQLIYLGFKNTNDYDSDKTYKAMDHWKWKKIIKGLFEDYKNFDSKNIDKEKVNNSNYFSSYKGVLVLKLDLSKWPFNSRSFCPGPIIVLDTQDESADTLDHEYGHHKQYEMLGFRAYFYGIGIHSIFNKAKKGEYYSKFCEVTADILGGVDRTGTIYEHLNGSGQAGWYYLWKLYNYSYFSNKKFVDFYREVR